MFRYAAFCTALFACLYYLKGETETGRHLTLLAGVFLILARQRET